MGAAFKLLLFSFLVGFFILIFFPTNTVAAPTQFCGTGGCFTYDFDSKVSSCPDSQVITTDLSVCIDQLGSYQNTCCTTGGCTAADGTSLGLWDWNYASSCVATRDPIVGDCSFEYQYQTTTCGAYDSCNASYPAVEGLYPGRCSSSGCTQSSTQYKTCCNADGTIDGLCVGGQFTGSCPVGTETIICGVTEADCNAVCGGDGCRTSQGIYCTTQPCGSNACSILGTPEPTLNSFSGSCSGSTYTASLSWSGDPLPSTDSGCPNGYWVDISTSSSFSTYSNKCVTGTSTSAPAGFSAPFTFNGGTNYYARVFNGQHSGSLSLLADTCAPPPPGTIPIGGKVTSCSTGAAISGVGVTVYDSTLNTTRVINTDSSGNFSTTTSGDFVKNGDNYAVRAPAPPQAFNSVSYSSRSPSTNYENQVAGGSPNCGTGCNFCYQPTPPPGTPSVTCSASPNPANSGQSVTWTASPSGGSGTYTQYSWSGAVSGTTKQVTSIYTNTTSSTMTKTATVTVTDSNGITSAPFSCSVIINPAPVSNCDITSAIPNPVPWNSSTSSFNFTQINWTTSGKGGSNLYYYNPGICSLASCPLTGWSLITSAPYDASFSYVWNPNSFFPAQGSTHTIGLTGADNILCDTYNISFGSASSTPGPTSTPAPTAPPPENPDYVYVTVRVVKDDNPQPNPYPKCNYPAGGCIGDPAQGAPSNQCLVVPDQTGEDICDDGGCYFDAFAKCDRSSNYPVICHNAVNNQSCFYSNLPSPSNIGVANVRVGGSCQYWDGSSGGVTSGVTDASGWANLSIYRPWRFVPYDQPLVNCTLSISNVPSIYSKTFSTCQYDNRYRTDSFTQSPSQRIVILGSGTSCGPLKSFTVNSNEADEFFFVPSPKTAAIFALKTVPTPWLKTTGGDVHTNERISVPGGP